MFHCFCRVRVMHGNVTNRATVRILSMAKDAPATESMTTAVQTELSILESYFQFLHSVKFSGFMIKIFENLNLYAYSRGENAEADSWLRTFGTTKKDAIFHVIKL